MFKQAGRFLNRQSGSGRNGRFNTGLAKSDRLGRQDRNGGDCATHWRLLAKRLDAEVASVTPSHQKKEHRAPARAHRPLREPTNQRVYLVAFRLKADMDIVFVKIGISAYDIRARFRADMRNYDVALLAESAKFTGQDAGLAEKAIHSAFKAHRFRPPVALTSGNSECYAYTEQNLRRFVDIVNAI